MIAKDKARRTVTRAKRRANKVGHVAMSLRGMAQQLRRIKPPDLKLRIAACNLERVADDLIVNDGPNGSTGPPSER